jgi:hypothetical protein
MAEFWEESKKDGQVQSLKNSRNYRVAKCNFGLSLTWENYHFVYWFNLKNIYKSTFSICTSQILLKICDLFNNLRISTNEKI